MKAPIKSYVDDVLWCVMIIKIDPHWQEQVLIEVSCQSSRSSLCKPVKYEWWRCYKQWLIPPGTILSTQQLEGCFRQDNGSKQGSVVKFWTPCWGASAESYRMVLGFLLLISSPVINDSRPATQVTISWGAEQQVLGQTIRLHGVSVHAGGEHVPQLDNTLWLAIIVLRGNNLCRNIDELL